MLNTTMRAAFRNIIATISAQGGLRDEQKDLLATLINTMKRLEAKEGREIAEADTLSDPDQSDDEKDYAAARILRAYEELQLDINNII